MNDILQRSKDAANKLEQLKSEMLECNSDRTFFQLEKFVMNQHDTEGRRYLQIITELSGCYFEIKRMLIDMDEARHDARWWKNPFKKRRALLKIENLEFQLDAKIKEFSKLLSIKDTLKKYTAQEIEAEEQRYYEARLKRQSNEFRLSNSTGIPVGELRSQEQAGMIEIKSEMIEGSERISIVSLSEKQLTHSPSIKQLETK